MGNAKRIVAALALAFLTAGCAASITAHENSIRAAPFSTKTALAREKILAEASAGHPWDEVNRSLAQLEDIDGARYDEENHRLVIWGPKAEASAMGAMPPLLIDDFVVALTVLKAGENPGVSIGTISGRIPTQSDSERALRTRRLPVEYIPPSTSGTHLGSVLFEVDRTLKGLAHGEDNLTRASVISSVPGYTPVSRLLRVDPSAIGTGPRPLGLWWFVPDPTGVAIDGYIMKFVRYRMRVEYKSLVSDPAIEVFGKHMSEHFDDFAREFVTFRELVRLHKLVAVARWYQESGFPADEFLNSYRPLAINTPDTTRMIQTLAGTIPGPGPRSYYALYLIGGVDLSPRNYYMPAASVAPTNLAPGTVTQWRQDEVPSRTRYTAPPRFGSYGTSPAPVPPFVKPIFEARPSPTAMGWTATVGGKNFAVVSIPARKRKATSQEPTAPKHQTRQFASSGETTMPISSEGDRP